MSIVRTPLDFFLWKQAQTKLEWGATRYWEHVIRPYYPAEEGWVLASQQPPTDEDSNMRRVELKLDRWKNGKGLTHKVLILECKKENASQPEIDTVEAQAFDGCMACLGGADQKYMYAFTTVGTKMRQWIAHVDEPYLVPWNPPGTNLADKSQYIEAHSTDGYLITDGLAYIKKHDEMPEEMVRALRQALIQSSTSAGHYEPSSESKPEQTEQSGDYKVNYTSYSADSNPGKGKEVDMTMGGTQDEIYFSEDNGEGDDDYSQVAETRPYQAPYTETGGGPARQHAASHSGISTGEGQELDMTMVDTQHEKYRRGKAHDEDPAEDTRKAYHKVKVERKYRLGRKDEILFTDRKGRKRATTVDEWTNITHDGRPAWTYSHYVTLDKKAFNK